MAVTSSAPSTTNSPSITILGTPFIPNLSISSTSSSTSSPPLPSSSHLIATPRSTPALSAASLKSSQLVISPPNSKNILITSLCTRSSTAAPAGTAHPPPQVRQPMRVARVPDAPRKREPEAFLLAELRHARPLRGQPVRAEAPHGNVPHRRRLTLRERPVELEGVPAYGVSGRGRAGDRLLEEGDGAVDARAGEVAEGADGVGDDFDFVVCHCLVRDALVVLYEL
ncbi:hypothetical protein CCMA1212_000175 [Trichoderma ghanense]|uniref:Uncharacterized protein n=1 Tax=Trichoderma ghanense TaxID=65468 RepID=A0ABY2HL49_9HYPO